MALLGSTLGLLRRARPRARARRSLFRSSGSTSPVTCWCSTPCTVIAAYVVGIGVTMVAAFVPARRAAKVPPVAAMRDDLGCRRGAAVAGWRSARSPARGRRAHGRRPGRRARRRRGLIGAGAVDLGDHRRRPGAVLGQPVLLACRAVFGKLFGTTGQPRRRERAAQPASYGRHRVGADDRPGRGLGRRRARLVAERDQRRRWSTTSSRSDFLVQSAASRASPPRSATRWTRSTASHGLADAGLGRAGQGKDQTFVMGVDDAFGDIYELDMRRGTQQMSGDQAILSESTAAETSTPTSARRCRWRSPGADHRPRGRRHLRGHPDHPGRDPADQGPRGRRSSAQRQHAQHQRRRRVPTSTRCTTRSTTVVEDLPIVTVQDKEGFADLISSRSTSCCS